MITDLILRAHWDNGLGGRQRHVTRADYKQIIREMVTSALWEDLGKQADIILYHPASSSAASSVTSFMSPASSSSLFLSPLLVSATEKTITPTSRCDSSAPSSDLSYFTS